MTVAIYLPSANVSLVTLGENILKIDALIFIFILKQYCSKGIIKDLFVVLNTVWLKFPISLITCMW